MKRVITEEERGLFRKDGDEQRKGWEQRLKKGQRGERTPQNAERPETNLLSRRTQRTLTPERTERHNFLLFLPPLNTPAGASAEPGGGGGARRFAAEAEMMAESWPSARFYNPGTFNFL